MKELKLILSTTDNLKARILKLKQERVFPRQHVKLFVETYPQYDNLRGITKYQNVISLKSTDEDITLKIEVLSKCFEHKGRGIKKRKRIKA